MKRKSKSSDSDAPPRRSLSNSRHSSTADDGSLMEVVAKQLDVVTLRLELQERLAAVRLLLFSFLRLRDSHVRRVLLAGNGQVCLVSTAIWGASELRRRSPSFMGSLADVVTLTARRTLMTFLAAEVQCDSDGSLLLAFGRVEDAIRWTIVFSDALGLVAWDEETLKAAECRPVEGPGGHLLFNGPRIQIGLTKGRPAVEQKFLCDRFLPGGTLVAQARGLLHMALEGEILIGSACYADVTASKLFNEGAISLSDRGEYMIVNGEAQLVRSLCTTHTFRRQHMYQLAGRKTLRAAISIEEDKWTVLPSNVVEHNRPTGVPMLINQGDRAPAPAAPKSAPRPPLLETLAEVVEAKCSGDTEADCASVLQAVRWMKTEKQWLQQELRKCGMKPSDFEDMEREARGPTLKETAWRPPYVRELEDRLTQQEAELEDLRQALQDIREAAALASEQTPAFLQKEPANVKEGLSLFFRRTKTQDFSELLMLSESQPPEDEPEEDSPAAAAAVALGPRTKTLDVAGRYLEKQGLPAEPPPAPKTVNIPTWLKRRQQDPLGAKAVAQPRLALPAGRPMDAEPKPRGRPAKPGANTLMAEPDLLDPYDIAFSKKGHRGPRRGSQSLPVVLEPGADGRGDGGRPMIVLGASAELEGFDADPPLNRSKLSVKFGIPDLDALDRMAHAHVAARSPAGPTDLPPPPDAELPSGTAESSEEAAPTAAPKKASRPARKRRPVASATTASFASKVAQHQRPAADEPSRGRRTRPPFRCGGVAGDALALVDPSTVATVKGWTPEHRKRLVYLGLGASLGQ
eukprot:EG_transcript_2962